MAARTIRQTGACSGVLLAALSACGEPTPAQPDADVNEACAGTTSTTTLVDIFASGPLTGASATVTIPPTSRGDLLVVTIASTTTGWGVPSMFGAQRATQVGLDGPCNKHLVIWSLGNVIEDVSSLDVQMGHEAAFAVFVARFRGLPADVGAKPSFSYSHSLGSAVAPRVAACPGAAVVSAVASCGDVALSPASAFTSAAAFEGINVAAYVPDVAGSYTAEWNAVGSAAATTVALH